MKLSATNQSTAEALENEFSQTLFQSAEQFIQAYNSGMVNRRNTTIADLAHKVEEAYRNIELSGGELTAISTDAISLNEINEAYTRWSVIVAVRNAIRDFETKNSQVESFILSDEGKKGSLLAVTKVEIATEDDEFDSDASESLTSYEFTPIVKVARNAEAAAEALGDLADLVEIEDFVAPVVTIRPSIRDVDTTFLETVAEELSQH